MDASTESPQSQSISPLRQRMLDDMRMRKLADKTQSHYIRAVCRLTRARTGHGERGRSTPLSVAPGRPGHLAGDLERHHHGTAVFEVTLGNPALMAKMCE